MSGKIERIDFEKLKNITYELHQRIENLQNEIKVIKEQFKPFTPISTSIYSTQTKNLSLNKRNNK